jgi:hypothetical protein
MQKNKSQNLIVRENFFLFNQIQITPPALTTRTLGQHPANNNNNNWPMEHKEEMPVGGEWF